jgi:hypothetical protein
MASGCPVIVPDLWGAEEIVDYGRAGLIYRSTLSPHSALACLEELKQPARWEQYSKAGRALVEQRYSPEAVVGRYLEVFQEAFKTPRVSSAAYRLGWALKSASFYSKALPPAVSHYRPRRAAEALERALREHQSGHHARVKDDLLEALKVFPVVYLKPWRAKFLLRTLLSSRSHG